MKPSIVKILATAYLTPNVKQLTVQKPRGFTYRAGQAVDLAINHPSLEYELRPFTITSLETDNFLEFTIKIYESHHGITEKLAQLVAGDELLLHEPFGTIEFKGPGLFIAAGTGITPFLAILRKLKTERPALKNHLLFANRTVTDIILPDELQELLGESYHNIFSEEGGEPHYVDSAVLGNYTDRGFAYYYICGPDSFVSKINDVLLALGIDEGHIVYER